MIRQLFAMVIDSPLALVLVAAGLMSAAHAQQRILVNRPVAILNNHVITELELRKELRAHYGETADPLNATQRRAVLSQLVSLVLIEEAAGKVTLDPRRVEEEARRAALQAERLKGSRSEFLSDLVNRGETYEGFLAKQRDMVRHRAFYQSIPLRLGPTGRPSVEIYIAPHELRRFYRQQRERFHRPAAIEGRRILLLWSAFANRESARARARTLLASASAGDESTFAALARSNSGWNSAGAGELSGSADGTPRWVELGENTPLPAAIASACKAARRGLQSSAVETAEGVNLIWIDAIRAEGLLPFGDPGVQRGIRDELRGRRIERLRALSQQDVLESSFFWAPEIGHR